MLENTESNIDISNELLTYPIPPSVTVLITLIFSTTTFCKISEELDDPFIYIRPPDGFDVETYKKYKK
jgi:hypothetical protein